MKPALFLAAAALVFAVLIAGAVAWDCVRAVGSANELVAATDRELSNQEERVIRSLPAAGIRGAELDRAVESYRTESEPAAKRRAFDGVLAVASQSPSAPLDANDLVGRRAADEYTGALNRRQIALRAYQDATAARESLANSARGRIGLELAGTRSGRPASAD